MYIYKFTSALQIAADHFYCTCLSSLCRSYINYLREGHLAVNVLRYSAHGPLWTICMFWIVCVYMYSPNYTHRIELLTPL